MLRGVRRVALWLLLVAWSWLGVVGLIAIVSWLT